MSDDAPAPPSRRVIRRWPIIAAAIASLTVVFCLFGSWSGIWGSHPAYAISLLLVALVSAGMAVWAWRTPPRPPRSAWRTWLPRAALVLGTLFTTMSLLYLRPLSADQVAVDALRSTDELQVTTSTGRIVMEPAAPLHTGLVFYPGAKVDPRAYARILRPVAEAGFPVVIVKFPYNLAVFGIDAAGDIVGRDDDVQRWVVGGHSLGGAMACSYAGRTHDELAGLLLYAAYPASSIRDRTGLEVVSVYGTEDGLATVDDIEKSKADLPADATFVPVEGGVHAFFGDYGPQRGDGTATIDRDEAQRQIIDATLEMMRRIDANP